MTLKQHITSTYGRSTYKDIMKLKKIETKVNRCEEPEDLSSTLYSSQCSTKIHPSTLTSQDKTRKEYHIRLSKKASCCRQN